MNENVEQKTPGGVPDRDDLARVMTGFQSACVIGAAAELDVLTHLSDEPKTAEDIAGEMDVDLRAVTVLLDALAALRLVAKKKDGYTASDAVRDLLIDGNPQTMLPMVRHWMNCLRGWSQLAWVVKSGEPAERMSSIRGAEADRAAFVAGMHSVSEPNAGPLIQRLLTEGGLEPFEHLLDVGGASGTWTMAFLKASPTARATIFDLPDAIEQAKARIGASEYADRVQYAAGDFYEDALPAGVDFAWVSAIIHQHSREESRALFGKVHTALEPGGRIGIRDVVMSPSRTEPAYGALFAVNMLVHTARGGTFTFDEITEDLEAAGFVDVRLAIETEAMDSVVVARKAG